MPLTDFRPHRTPSGSGFRHSGERLRRNVRNAHETGSAHQEPQTRSNVDDHGHRPATAFTPRSASSELAKGDPHTTPDRTGRGRAARKMPSNLSIQVRGASFFNERQSSGARRPSTCSSSSARAPGAAGDDSPQDRTGVVSLDGHAPQSLEGACRVASSSTRTNPCSGTAGRAVPCGADHVRGEHFATRAFTSVLVRFQSAAPAENGNACVVSRGLRRTQASGRRSTARLLMVACSEEHAMAQRLVAPRTAGHGLARWCSGPRPASPRRATQANRGRTSSADGRR